MKNSNADKEISNRPTEVGRAHFGSKIRIASIKSPRAKEGGRVHFGSKIQTGVAKFLSFEIRPTPSWGVVLSRREGPSFMASKTAPPQGPVLAGIGWHLAVTRKLLTLLLPHLWFTLLRYVHTMPCGTQRQSAARPHGKSCAVPQVYVDVALAWLRHAVRCCAA